MTTKIYGLDVLNRVLRALPMSDPEKHERLTMIKKKVDDMAQASADIIEPVALPDGVNRVPYQRFLERFPQLLSDVGGVLGYDHDILTIEIGALEKFGMLAFGEIEGTLEPCAFTAPEAQFKDLAEFKRVADAVIRWFDRSGDYNTRTRETDERSFEQWQKEFPLAVAAIAEEARVSRRVVTDILQRWSEAGQIVFKVESDDTADRTGVMLRNDLEPLNNSERAILKLLQANATIRHVGNGNVIIPNTTPDDPGTAYMRAIREQYATLAHISEAVAALRRKGKTTMLGVPVDNYEFNVDILRRAETFCWYDEPTTAVEITAGSMPDSVRMTRDLTGATSGWWYFDRPLAIETLSEQNSNPKSKTIRAMLWAWTVRDGKAGLYVSAYVHALKDRDELLPSTEFFWTEGQSLHQMLSRMYDEWLQQYGPGSPLEHLTKSSSIGVFGPAETNKIIENMARFFSAGCLWMQQKILSFSRGHVERHERKRIIREAKLEHLSDVQVIQLRRKDVRPVAKTPDGESKFVDWSCRWIVTWHWRNQYYPKEGIYKPKFIFSYTKGPDDKPLKVPTHRVYAVSR